MIINGEQNLQSSEHQRSNSMIRDKLLNSPSLKPNHWNRNLLTYLTPANYARTIYLNELYQKITNIPGVILEFGVNYGSSFISFLNLRGIYEPYNHTRRVVGFDTFQGFPATHSKDSSSVRVGDYNVEGGWYDELEEICSLNESLSPMSHLKRFELIKGNILETLPIWLEENPGLTIAFAHFDVDLYEPTKFALEMIESRLVKGSILAFDEFSDSDWPGETMAVLENFQDSKINIKRSKLQNNCAYLTVE